MSRIHSARHRGIGIRKFDVNGDIVCKISLSFRFRISLSDMTNYKSAFGKVCRIKNRQTFKSMPILNSAYHAVKFEWYDELQIGRLLVVCQIKNRQTFKSMPILNSAYHAVKYAELRIGILLKVCRFVIRHITQTQTETETELLRRHVTLHFDTACKQTIIVSTVYKISS